jgi:putative membrane protein
MRFLKILLWVLVAVLAIIFAGANWRDVDVALWGGLILTIKLPFLLLLVALAAWLPTWLIGRGKIWRLQRQIAVEHSRPVPPPPPAPKPTADDEEFA